MILRKEEPDGTFDRLSVNVAMVAAVRAVVSAQPLDRVDDAQWARPSDRQDARLLVRRLAGTSVRITVVSRSKPDGGPARRANGYALPEQRLTRSGWPDRPGAELSRILRRVIGMASRGPGSFG